MLNEAKSRFAGGIKSLFFLFFILLLTMETYPQDGWFWQNPLPTGNLLNDIFFIDNNIGTAVGEYGTIIRTTDGGNNWIVQSIGKTYTLNAVYFSDVNNGTAVGFDNTGSSFGDLFFLGIILRTTDGGENWIMQSNELDCMLNGVFFTDDNNGTAVGGGTAFGGGFGTILRTSDGGENWVNQLCDTTTIAFNDVSFTDINTGTVVGRGYWNGELQRYESKIMKTTDGGKSWINQNSGVTCQLHAVCFINSNVGWIVGGDGYITEKSVILKTTDGGENWITQLNDSITNGIYDVCFVDANNGMAVGSVWKDTLDSGYSYIIIFKTTDGGSNWICQSTGIQGRWNKFFFTDANVGTIVGLAYNYTQKRIILRTTDAGNHWINQVKGPIDWFRGVSFTDRYNGTTVGSSGTIVRTTNGGSTWITQRSNMDDLRGVCFADSDHGMAVGYQTILRTTNGGKNWIVYNHGKDPLYGIYTIDINNAIAVGSHGTILKTTNGGVSWLDKSINISQYYSGVFFTDVNTGIVVGGEGTILKTTDGGNNWDVQSSKTNNDLYFISFINKNIGIAVGVGGTILKTQDGGKSWSNQSSGTNNLLLGISFADSNNVTIVGSGGTILRSMDGGNTWNSQFSGTYNELAGVCFTDCLHGWIVGDNSTIFHTTNGGITYINEEKTIDEIPKDFFLFQNYPNPFNPTTTIKYSIPEQTVGNENFRSVRLIVYDVLGKEVATLVNEEKPAGTYKVTWNAANLPSGVYFYQLRAGSYSATKKLLLLK